MSYFQGCSSCIRPLKGIRLVFLLARIRDCHIARTVLGPLDLIMIVIMLLGRRVPSFTVAVIILILLIPSLTEETTVPC